MTVSTINVRLDFASDPKYKTAKSILENRFSDFPKTLDFDIIANLSKQVVYELATDTDFCDDKHQASLFALEWLFQEIYQRNVPLEKNQFLLLCGDSIIPLDMEKEEISQEIWYKKI